MHYPDLYVRTSPSEERGRPRNWGPPSLFMAGSTSSVDSESHFITDAAQGHRELHKLISRERVRNEILHSESLKVRAGTPESNANNISTLSLRKVSIESEGGVPVVASSKQHTSEGRTEEWARTQQQQQSLHHGTIQQITGLAPLVGSSSDGVGVNDNFAAYSIVEDSTPKLPEAWITELPLQGHVDGGKELYLSYNQLCVNIIRRYHTIQTQHL